MQPRISLITLAVDDLDRAVRFYRDGLRLHTDGIVGAEFEYGAVAFFDLGNGLRLALWPRRSLARDSGLPLSQPASTDFCLAHNVATKAEVDAVMAEAGAAGAAIVKPAQDTFWGGYAGYFTDPDGHMWEVAFNPQESQAAAATPRLRAAIPKLASLDIERSLALFERLGFRRTSAHADYGIARRDAVEIHFWRCSDPRIPKETGCRIEVDGLDRLYEECLAQGVVQPNGRIGDRPWGVREFSILDADGNLVTFEARAHR